MEVYTFMLRRIDELSVKIIWRVLISGEYKLLIGGSDDLLIWLQTPNDSFEVVSTRKTAFLNQISSRPSRIVGTVLIEQFSY